MQRSYDSAGEQQNGRRKSSPKSHQPKISRKIRACQECQGRKIKCGIEPGESACARCRKFGLQCILNKSLQTLLEDECEWKKDMEKTTTQLQSVVYNILQQLDMPIEALASQSQSSGDSTPSYPPIARDVQLRTRNIHRTMSITRSNTPELLGLNEAEDDTLATPMASLFEVVKPRDTQVSSTDQLCQVPDVDSITSGRIRLADAEDMFIRFITLLDQYPWCRVALVHDTLASVRKSSSMLMAAIVAVAALHAPGKEALFDVAYSEFLVLVGESMFDHRHSLDDIRAFCIGALWLSDISWKLSGHAVRIATQMNLHKSVVRAIRGQAEHVERARLWYLLYVCDHQLSIAYGRPHIIQEDTPIWYHKSFLQLPGVTQYDWHLHSQVALCHILSRVYQVYGSDTDKALSEANFATLDAFNVEIDAWRAEWELRLVVPTQNGVVCPSRGVLMHWNFARLQLNALALRGISPQQAHLISNQRRDFANLAVAHALETFNFITEDSSAQDLVLGVELYMHTMITYAAVFLLRAHMRWKAARLKLNLRLTLSLVERSAQLLNQTNTGERHLAFYIADGLEKMLVKFKELDDMDFDQTLACTDLGDFSALEKAGHDQWVPMGCRADAMFTDMAMYTMDHEFTAGVSI